MVDNKNDGTESSIPDFTNSAKGKDIPELSNFNLFSGFRTIFISSVKDSNSLPSKII